MMKFEDWQQCLKLKFCEYTGYDPAEPIDADKLDNADWNSFRRVCREEGCTHEGLTEALKLKITE